MSQRLIFNRLYFDDARLDKTIVEKFHQIKQEEKEFSDLQTAFRRKPNEARNADIKSGKITDLIPKLNRQTAEKFFLGAAATSDLVAIEIVWNNLNPRNNGKNFLLVIAEAFREAAARDDIKMMDWLWSRAEIPKDLINKYKQCAFFDACENNAEIAVYWMWEKAYGDIDMREALGMILQGRSRLELSGVVRRRERQYADFLLAVTEGDIKKMDCLWLDNLPIDFIKSHNYHVVYNTLNSQPVIPATVNWLWEKVPNSKRHVMIETFTPELRDLLQIDTTPSPSTTVEAVSLVR